MSDPGFEDGGGVSSQNPLSEAFWARARRADARRPICLDWATAPECRFETRGPGHSVRYICFTRHGRQKSLWPYGGWTPGP